MQNSRILSGALIGLPVTIASLSVMIALNGCGGATTATPIPLPDLQQQQLGGVVNMTGFFSQYNPDSENLPPPQAQQQSCPQYNPISPGIYELDYGTGCQPSPGAPIHSGKILVAQDRTGANLEINFDNFSGGNGFVVNGSLAYSLDSNTGSYTIQMNLTQTPATGIQQACTVQFQFSGTFTPNSSGGYTLNGQGTQITTLGNNSISYQITYNNVSSSSGCNYPTGGSVTVQPLAPTGAPLGAPTTINYNTGQCGIAQVTFGNTTLTVNLANFAAPNPCQGAPRI